MYGYSDMMDGWGGGYNHGDGIVSMIFMFTMMLLFVALIIWAVRSFGRVNNNSGIKDNSLELLKRRYAIGEIDKKQFEQIKKDLNDK